MRSDGCRTVGWAGSATTRVLKDARCIQRAVKFRRCAHHFFWLASPRCARRAPPPKPPISAPPSAGARSARSAPAEPAPSPLRPGIRPCSTSDSTTVGSGAGIIRPDLATGNGMYRSNDTGRTWTHLGGGLDETQMIAYVDVDPANPDRLFVAALGHPSGPNAERGVYRSTDGGRTFAKVLYKAEILLSATRKHWLRTDGVGEIGSPGNARVVCDHFGALGVSLFAQRMGW